VIAGGFVKFVSVESFPDEAIVRRAGGRAGIVVGRSRMTLTTPNNASSTVNSRYTHVFSEAAKGWQLISAQGTEIKTD
jgi:hypothetical protein